MVTSSLFEIQFTQLYPISNYISHVFFFFFFFLYSEALTSWGLADPGETDSFRISQFLEIVNNLLVSTASVFKPVNLKPILLTTSFITVSHSRPLSTCSNHPRARQPTTSSCPQSRLKLFRRIHPKPAYIALLVPPWRNCNKGSYSQFPSLPLPHVQPCASLYASPTTPPSPRRLRTASCHEQSIINFFLSISHFCVWVYTW